MNPKEQPKKVKKERKQRLWLSISSLLLAILMGFSILMLRQPAIYAFNKTTNRSNLSEQIAYDKFFADATMRAFHTIQTAIVGTNITNTNITSNDPLTRDQKSVFLDIQSTANNAKLQLNNNYNNLNYYAENTNTGTAITNDPATINYDYFIQENIQADKLITFTYEHDRAAVTFNNRLNILIRDDLLLADVSYPLDSLRRIVDDYPYSNNPIHQNISDILSYYDSSDVRNNYKIAFSVSQDLLYSDTFERCYQNYQIDTIPTKKDYLVLYWTIASAVLGLLALVIFFLNIKPLCRKCKVFNQWMAKILNHIVLEAKVVLNILYLWCVPYLILNILDPLWYRGSAGSGRVYIIVYAIALYIAIVDFIYNKSEVFRHNIMRYWIRKYKAFEQKKSFQKKMHLRALMLSLGLILLGLCILFSLLYRNLFCLFFGCVFIVLILFWYCRQQFKTAEDIDKMTDKVEQIYQGNLDCKIDLSSDSDMYQVGIWLDGVQQGIDAEVNNRIKSERMKVELITNVSHDLKTPLTSMINYIKLLDDELLSPDFANDYVDVLHKKVGRLKTMVEDLFDVAKANSGNMEVVKECIELGELIDQTLGEAQADIAKSCLDFRINNAGQKVYVEADGPKMWRIVSNVVGNAVKYAMPGTRVYIDITEENNTAQITFKNIANYEMNFTSDEIFERFKRGDESRSIEGSGLGLSIVKSFAQLQGGTFDVAIDGDLFKAIIRFPVHTPNQKKEEDIW